MLSLPWQALLTLLLTGGVFAADILLPATIATEFLYVPVMLLTLAMPGRAWTLAAAVLVTGLACIAHFVNADSASLLQASVINRLLAVAAVWIVWLLTDQRQRSEERLVQANAALDERISDRTAALQQTVAELNTEVAHRERTQADFERQTQLLLGLMDAIPDNIYFKDAEGRYLLINHAKARRSGLQHPRDAIGTTDFDYFTPEHARIAQAAEHEIMRTGEARPDVEERLVWPDGSVTWVSSTKVPLRDPHGRVIGTLGISRDITTQRRMRKHWSRNAIDSAR